MSDIPLDFDQDLAIDRLMQFLSVEGITGQEKAIGEEVVRVLRQVGVPDSAILFDQAHQKIPLPTQTGNLIVKLPGTRPGPRRMFMTHLDTVPLCAGAKPIRRQDRITSDGTTGLGADNRTGVGTLVTMIATLLEKNLPHPPTTVLFTVREESGLWGARFVDPADLDHPSMCFNVDGKSPRNVTIAAVGADRWECEIFGRAAHAGVAPQEGISATMVASLALAEVFRHGWFGKVRKKGLGEGTSNVGSISNGKGGSAGQATNVVTDYVHVRGECRSHDAAFIGRITRAYKEAFCKAAKQVCNDKGRSARVHFRAQRDYYPFKLKPNAPVVKQALAAAQRAGFEAQLHVSNGGLDANWLVRHKIPTITFGGGQNEVHTVNEWADLNMYLEACRFALALATHEEAA